MDTRTTAEADTKRSMINRKPFRTAEQKAEAKRLARKCDDGTWRSSAPVSYHKGADDART